MVRYALQVAAVTRMGLALSQCVDSLDCSRFGRVRVAVSKIGFLLSNPWRYNFKGAETASDTKSGRNRRFEFVHSKIDFITDESMFEE